jgi:hypothetical protein
VTDSLLTIAEVCAELRDDDGNPLSRATFYRWRTLGKAPKCSSSRTARSACAGRP